MKILFLRSYWPIAIILVVFSVAIIYLKFTKWNYSFKSILPTVEYEVNYNFSLEGFAEPVKVKSYIPMTDSRQTIRDELHNSGRFNLQILQENSGRIASWSNDRVSGPENIKFSFVFSGEAIQYEIDPNIIVPSSYPREFDKYLSSTKNIQSDHPFIVNLFHDKVRDTDKILYLLQDIHKYTHSLTPRPFKGVTDALTAAKLEEASCNGKSRLFVALARNAGIPSRLVGGIILEDVQKKTTHQWVEVYIQGHWVPFDPLNDHFANLPSNYLTLYKGDEFILSHTPNINFDYTFNINKRLVANPLLVNELASHHFNAYNVWRAFQNIGIPLELLKIILLVPLGAFIVALCRNVIGIKTYGIFLPALIAIACRETGLLWGIIAFILIIGIVSLVHFPLERWNVLFTPKMVIMLVCVVIMFMGLSILGIKTGINALGFVTLFPIVVVTITAERFARTITEEGYLNALRLTGQTLIVSAGAYLAMNSRSMESFFLAFPELFLAVIGFSLILGQWVGFRLTEYARFKWIIR